MTSCARRAHQAVVGQSSRVELPTGFGLIQSMLGDVIDGARQPCCCESSLSFPRNIRIYDQDLCHRLTKNSICLSLSPRSKYIHAFSLEIRRLCWGFSIQSSAHFLKFPVIIYCWIYKWTIRAGGKPRWRIVRYSEYSQAIPSSPSSI